MGRDGSPLVCFVCGSKSDDKHNKRRKITFHAPSRHEPTKKKWADALKHIGKVEEGVVVCSNHFSDSDFMVKNVPGAKPGEVNKVLKKIAVPTLMLSRPVETRKTIKMVIKKEKNKDTPKVTIKTEKVEKDSPKLKVKKEKEDGSAKTVKTLQKVIKKEKRDHKESKVQKKQPEPILPQPRHQSRRAASKEALKQMQILLDDEDDDTPVEIPDDDDDVIPLSTVAAAPQTSQTQTLSHTPPSISNPPPKKKYKLSHRKSADGNDREVLVLKSITPSLHNHYVENNLELECWTEELEPCQKERMEKLQEEEKSVKQILDELVKNKNAEVVHKGDLVTAIEITEHIQNTIKNLQNVPPPSQTSVGQNIVLNSSIAAGGTAPYQLVMDSRGIIVGAVPSPQQNVPTPPAPAKQTTNVQPAIPAPTTPMAPRTRGRGRGRGGTSSAPPPRILNTAGKRMATLPPLTPPVTRGRGSTSAPPTPPVAAPNITPTAVSASNPRPSETNVEGGLSAGGSKPKGVVDLTGDDGRPLPDSREIAFNKLQGKTFPSLVVVARPHLRVGDANSDRAKLDGKVKSVLMLAPTKFTEWLIQQGLVRSEQKCSLHGNNQLKLGMYSDVSKFPFSGGYVWISECCSQRFVSVFSGSLFEGSPHPPLVILKLLYHWACQTNIQNVVQWVKVDNLYVKGMYTWLRSVCTCAIHTHFPIMGGPNKKVEVGVISLGTTSQDGNSRQVKVEVLGVLETDTKLIRLRAVEPLLDNDHNYKKRFSKILEPLAQWVDRNSVIVTDLTVDKSTLQQMGFVNVFQSTGNDSNICNRTVMEYLRRIVPRMFQNTLSLLSRQIIQQFLDELVWRECFGTTSFQAFEKLIIHLAEQTRSENNSKLIARLNRIALNPFKNWSLNPTQVQSAAAPTVKPTQSENSTPMSKKRKRKEAESGADARPPKSNSPDVPEQMVPLENYYYGTIETFQQKANVVLNMKCPFCKEHFNNNILLMNHLFQHAHNVSKDGQMCRYCLASTATANDLQKHIASSHPSETKFDNGFVCLICETHYMNPFVLGRHMSREHHPSELPYTCGSCGHRCSNHKQAIDHFYKQHDNGSTIQCPFCLKSTTVFSASRNIVQNMNYFIQHLQKHQRKQFARRCGKCNLWFVQKEALKEHQQRSHTSQRGKKGMVPWTAPRNGVMVPKSKMDRYPSDAEVINFGALHYTVPKNLTCRECDTPMDSLKHFPSFESCQNPNCQYSTCCTNAMQEHNAKCSKNSTPLPSKEPLPYEMFCVCGHSSLDGNQMARHLAICERKSAYSSQTEASAASVTHSMLDVLGLVRKPGEKEKSSTSETKTEPITIEESELSSVLTEEKQEPLEIDEDVQDSSIQIDEDVVEESRVDVPMETDKDKEDISVEKTTESVSKSATPTEEKSEDSLPLPIEDEDVEMVESTTREKVTEEEESRTSSLQTEDEGTKQSEKSDIVPESTEEQSEIRSDNVEEQNDVSKSPEKEDNIFESTEEQSQNIPEKIHENENLDEPNAASPLQENNVSEKDDIFPNQSDDIASKENNISAENDTVLSENDIVPTESDIIPSISDTVPNENEIVPNENEIVPPENNIVPIEDDTVPNENNSNSPENTNNIENDIVPPENSAIPTENDTVLPENDSVISDTITENQISDDTEISSINHETIDSAPVISEVDSDINETVPVISEVNEAVPELNNLSPEVNEAVPETSDNVQDVSEVVPVISDVASVISDDPVMSDGPVISDATASENVEVVPQSEETPMETD